jgi:hypothetical protein
MSKSVVITGGSKGIGLELVKHYASNGFKVISGSRTKYGKFDKKIAPNIKEISIDVRNVESHELLAREAINETGKLDVYINNAGFLPEIPSVSGFDYTTVSTAQVPQIRFNGMIDNLGVRQTALVLIPGASDGPEHAMEAESIDGYNKDYYFYLGDDKQYLINVIEFDINKKIPLGFKNNATTNFKLTLNEMINFETPEVYVHDKTNDTYTDIVNGLFEVNLPAGVNNNQYEITFTNSTLAVNNNAVSNFTVFQNNNKELLNIVNPNK